MSKTSYVYIITNGINGTLYVGVTSDLIKRIWQHKNGAFDGFAKKYGCSRLVHYEVFSEVTAAISREKQLKGWRREKKIVLVQAKNPRWQDWRRIGDGRCCFLVSLSRMLRRSSDGREKLRR